MIDFFLDMPYFKSLNNVAINKLINSLTHLKFTRGQQVMKQGFFERH
jgi:hypothetical protein